MELTKEVADKFEIICTECRSIHVSVEVVDAQLIVLCELCENGYEQPKTKENQ